MPLANTASAADSDNSKKQKPAWWDTPVDLSHLNEEQRRITKQLLREECHAFAYDDEDIGSIPSLKLHITLHDTTRHDKKNVHDSPKATAPGGERVYPGPVESGLDHFLTLSVCLAGRMRAEGGV